ncbi:MAG TPA: cysteine rich repeat-containing protein [Pseudolabrys sp.]|nr:cysteine rich repeat-containing protein [Pseudolabrys sp.]
MLYRIVPAFAFLLVLSAATSYAQPKQSGSGGMFQGTPEERKACRHDSVKFCSDAIPDSLRVLTCLKEHRKHLSKACEQVLENHGQ